MHIGVPFVAILTVIIIVYFATKALGISIKFPLLLSCGFIGLFLGLMLPKLLLPQISLTGTVIILVFLMLIISVVLTRIFASEEVKKTEDISQLLEFKTVPKNTNDFVVVVENETSVIENTTTIKDIVVANINEEVESKKIHLNMSNITATVVQEATDTDDVVIGAYEVEELPVIPFDDNEEIEPFNTDGFDLNSVFEDNLKVLYYTPEEKQSSTKLKTKIYSDQPRVSTYDKSFIEEEKIVFEDIKHFDYDKNTGLFENEPASSSSTNNNYNDNNHHLDTCLKQQTTPETIQQSSYMDNTAQQNNLIQFPLAENPDNIDKNDYHGASSIEKVIDFSANLIQNNEYSLPVYVYYENVCENVTSVKQNIPLPLTIDTINPETDEYGNSFSNVGNVDEEIPFSAVSSIETEVIIKENHKISRETFFNDDTETKIECKKQETSEVTLTHVFDNELPDYRSINDVEQDKYTTLKKLNSEMQKHLLPKSVPKSDSIDDLLDFAFAQREKCIFDDAIMIFEMAYEMYPNSPFSMLLITEIANTYKQSGNYDAAISAMQKGLEDTNEEIYKKEFIASIAYIEIIKNILITNRIDLLPYEEIPDKVKEDIAKSFSSWEKSS